MAHQPMPSMTASHSQVLNNREKLKGSHQRHNRQHIDVTEFRQPLQVQSHLEVPRILVQLGHIQRT